MSYKIQLTLDVTLESKQDADRLAHRIMVDMENYDGVLSAVASRNELDEFVNNLPDSEFEPGMTLLMSMEEEK